MGLFSKDIKTMNDLFVHQLQDIYYAENQLVKALPTMADKATDPQLKQGFQMHLEETKGHVLRVEQVFKMHGVEAKTVNCPAIDGILDEAEEVAGDVDDARFVGGRSHVHEADAGLVTNGNDGRGSPTEADGHAGREGTANQPHEVTRTESR